MDERDRSEYCAGPIVNGCYILTSAHCVLGPDGKTPSSAIKIISGKYATKPDKDLGVVSKIHVFPKYLSAKNKNIYANTMALDMVGSDLAVIELAKCVDESLSIDFAPVKPMEKVNVVGYDRGVYAKDDDTGRLGNMVGRQAGGSELGDLDQDKMCLKSVSSGEECRPEFGSVIIRNGKVLGFTAYAVQDIRTENKTVHCGVNLRNSEIRKFLSDVMSPKTASSSKQRSNSVKDIQSVK